MIIPDIYDEFTSTLVRELARALLFMWGASEDGEVYPEYLEELAYILDTIRRGEPHYSRDPAGGASELWQEMWPLGYFWLLEVDQGSLPSGLLPDEPDGEEPEYGSGAHFIYIALKALGRDFTFADFCQHFRIMVRDLAREMGRLDEIDVDEHPWANPAHTNPLLH